MRCALQEIKRLRNNWLTEQRARLEDHDVVQMWTSVKAREENEALRTVNERLRNELAVITEQHVRVMSETCPTDERHCTCVPILRREIERLQGVRDHYYRVAVWFATHAANTPVPAWCELATRDGEPVPVHEEARDE